MPQFWRLEAQDESTGRFDSFWGLPERSCSGPLSWLLVVLPSFWCPLAWRSIAPISALIFPWCSAHVHVCVHISLFLSIQVILDYWTGAHPTLAGARACLVTSVLPNSLWPYGPWPARLLCPWDSPGKNTEVGCHFFLQQDHIQP